MTVAPSRRRLLQGAAAVAATTAVPGLGAAAARAGTAPLPAAPVAVPPATGSAPGGLLTSLLADPLGVEPGRPRLSWVVPDLLASSRQLAYQVQVATAAGALAAGRADVWDSGQAEGADSVAVEYAGPPLEPAGAYWWRVRSWVQGLRVDGRPGPVRISDWSAPQRVITAHGPDDWQGQPIWAADGTLRLTDGRLDVDLTITAVSAGLLLRGRDIDNCYLWQVMAGDPGRIRPHVRRGGTFTLIEDRTLAVPVPLGTPLRLSVELAGSTLRTFVDGELADERADSTYPDGSVGFRNGNSESQRIHHVRFTGPDGGVEVDEPFDTGPGVFAGGSVDGGDLVMGTGQQLLAQRGGPADWTAARVEFDLPDRPVVAAFLYATGRSPEPSRQYVYKAWVNGEFAGVGPARAKGAEARYQTHDVAALLRPGRNALAALCWAQQDRRFLAELVVLFADGSRQLIGTGPDWRVRRGGDWLPPSPGLNTSYYTAPSENVDARHEPVGWTEPGFDDGDWETPAARPAVTGLAPAPVEPMARHLVEPAAVDELSPGVWRIDLGREIVGGLRLTVDGTAGQVVEVRLGEELEADGRVRYHLRAGNIYRETWTLRDGPQTIEHWGYRGFRWAELVAPAGLDLSRAVEGVALKIAWADGDAAFASSDSGLDRVWEVCRYSIEASRQDVYQDTPTRERGPYEGDAVINQLSEYCTQRSYALARYSNSLLASRPTWPTEYRLMGPILAWEDYLATGDATHLAVDYDIFVERNLDEAINAAGLVEKDITDDLVDWPASNRDGYVFGRVNTVINAWQHASYAALARIASALGRSADAARYGERAAALRAAINEHLLVGEAYVDGTSTTHRAQHATAFPAALGVPDDGDLDRLGEWLAAGGMRVSVYGAQFLLDALYRGGHGQAALDLMTSTARESWLHMIDDLGATWVMESWDPAIKPNTTFSHAWGSAPGNVVGRWLAGVQVLEPGAALVGVAPQPGDLTWFDARVPTVRGPVRVVLDRRDGFRLDIVLPANSTGRVELGAAALGLPDLGAVRVRADGPAPDRADEPGRVVLTDVPPGRLRVTA